MTTSTFGNWKIKHQADIASLARSELIPLYRRRPQVETATSAMGFIDPARALAGRGYTIKTKDGLGVTWENGIRADVAATINRSTRIIEVSSRCTLPELRFSLAHELGHEVLGHEFGVTLHRDRRLDGPSFRVSQHERDADFFASQTLMPEMLVRNEFRKRFGTDQFVLNDDTAFQLSGKSFDGVANRIRNTRGLTNLLATCETYNWDNHISLTKAFGVSTTAMAIQLEDLKLVSGFSKQI